MLRHNQETNDRPQTLRIGSMVVKSLGQLLPHQLQKFHTRDFVYPVSGRIALMIRGLGTRVHGTRITHAILIAIVDVILHTERALAYPTRVLCCDVLRN